MNELEHIEDFRTFKAELDRQIAESAEGFVRIGYLLKKARDTDILKESGYSNVIEFAKAEYHIDKTTVSRFININDRFSEGGNSQYLKEQYRGFGYSKLAEMLQLPDAIIEELTPEFSKAEIADIKREYDEEKNISDLELLAEQSEAVSEETKEMNELEKTFRQIASDNVEIFDRLYEAKDRDEEQLFEALAPAGDMIYSVRLAGIGRLMMSVRAKEKKITLTNVRNSEKTEWEADSVMAAVSRVFNTASDDIKEAYAEMYNEPYPEKDEVAPVQQTEKKAVRKEKKVVRAVQKPEQPQSQIPKNEKSEKPEDEQIPGQDSIENHPEYMPETKDGTEGNEKQEEPETAENIEETEQECWRVIKEAGKKIELFIRDYSDGFIIPSESNVAAVEENCKSIITELKRYVTLKNSRL